MSLSIEKLKEDFSTLNPLEKVQFLKTVVTTPPGEWIEINGKVQFIPEGPRPQKRKKKRSRKPIGK